MPCRSLEGSCAGLFDRQAERRAGRIDSLAQGRFSATSMRLPLSLLLASLGLMLAGCPARDRQEAAPASAESSAPAQQATSTERADEEIDQLEFRLPPPATEPPATTAERPATAAQAPQSQPDNNARPASPSMNLSAAPSQTGPAGPALASEETWRGVLQPAEFIEFYQPFYPLHLRLDGLEGDVILDFIVTADGEIRDLEVAGATARELIPFALEAARDWRAIPALRNGQPFDAPVRLPISFVSERGTGEAEPGSPLERLFLVDETFYLLQDNGRLLPANMEITPVYRQLPIYPADQERIGAEGTVTLSFLVSPDGRAVDPRVVRSTNSAFDQAALKAIRYWQFVPRIRNGRAEHARAEVPIVFTAPR
jgi:TonB family protein